MREDVENVSLCILLYLHELHENGWQNDDDKGKLQEWIIWFRTL